MRAPRRVDLATVCFLLSGVACASDPPGRPANIFERAYRDVAPRIRNSHVCELISPDAQLTFILNSPGSQVFSVRSRCFMDVAIVRHDPRLCAQVKEVRTSFLDGSRISESACIEVLRHTDKLPRTTNAASAELLVRLFERHTDSEPDTRVDVVSRYHRSVRLPEFAEFARELPDFSQGDEAATATARALGRCDPYGSSDAVCALVECSLTRDANEISACFERGVFSLRE